MDAFDKLAKLAGASVESVGEGLPRTRAEALVLGVARYFTGVACKHGHLAERSAVHGKCKECERQRSSGRSGDHRWVERMRQYRASPKWKDRMRLWAESPDGIDRQRKKNLAKTGDEILFSINQAEYCARHGESPSGIAPECPEPQRSQLQALVDRIKADPQAGKAVVGLLRTMRELRKAELAEVRAASEGGAA